MKKAETSVNLTRVLTFILLILSVVVLSYVIHTEFIKPLHNPYDKTNDEGFNRILLEHNKLFADIVKVIIWPVVAIVVLVSLHTPLAEFLKGLGQRVSKLSFPYISIELAQVSEFKPPWLVQADDVRKVNPSVIFDAPSGDLFRQLSESRDTQYAVVNLERGNQWVTSRLFIFAVMLERAGLKCFVFLEDADDVSGRFIGIASPDKVRWELARHYPWLETAFALAYSSNIPHPPPGQASEKLVITSSGALEPERERVIVKMFLDCIQSLTPPNTKPEEWIEERGVYEHTEWIRGDRLRGLLQDQLQDSWVAIDQNKPSDETVKRILLEKAPYVALVERAKKFNSLVDRQEILEDVGKRVAIS